LRGLIIFAIYTGSPPYGESAGELDPVAIGAETTVQILPPTGPIVAGQNTTLRAQVLHAQGGTTVSGGSVEFQVDGFSYVAWGDVGPDGVAQADTTSIGVGTHEITAIFSGTALDEPAVSAPLTVDPSGRPGAATGVTALGGVGSATVSWAPPVWDGGSAIRGYVATASPGGATCSVAATQCLISGLAPGQYTFSVVASNDNGAGAASPPSGSVTVSAPPPPPPSPVPPTVPPALAWSGAAVPVSLVKPTFTWSVAPGSSALARIEVRVQSGATGAALGAFGPVTALAPTARSFTTGGVGGTTYCVQVQAIDAGGLASAPITRCSTYAQNDLLLTASKGWVTTKLKTAFLGEERRSVLVGSSLTIAKAKGTSIVLVVGKDAGSGTIGVYVKTKLVEEAARRAADHGEDRGSRWCPGLDQGAREGQDRGPHRRRRHPEVARWNSRIYEPLPTVGRGS